ncbi:carboxypeptidase-like regulatory domain-containing protein [Nitrospira sp. Ecomares 2.1]
MRAGITSRLTTDRENGLEAARKQLSARLRLSACLLMILTLVAPSTSTWAATGESSAPLSKFLEIPLEGTSIPDKLRFPLHEQNGVQYFSAGLGKEERSLSYPAYSLKLIFVKGERAFLAGVAVEVINSEQATLVSIPGEEVQGPWLFLNLPPGKYVVKATDSSGATIEKSITLSGGKTTPVHFRW